MKKEIHTHSFLIGFSSVLSFGFLSIVAILAGEGDMYVAHSLKEIGRQAVDPLSESHLSTISEYVLIGAGVLLIVSFSAFFYAILKKLFGHISKTQLSSLKHTAWYGLIGVLISILLILLVHSLLPTLLQ